MASYTGPNGQAPDPKQTQQNQQPPVNFRQLLAIICGCREEELDFAIPGLSDSGASWLDHFCKAQTCDDPTCTNDHMVTGWPVPEIEFHNNRVTGKINAKKSPEQNLFTALGMATLAMAQKPMREGGANLEAKTIEEMAYLMIAAEYIGLKINNPPPQITSEQLAHYKEQLNAEKIWQDFQKTIRQDPPAHPAPQHGHAHAPANSPAPQSARPGLRERVGKWWQGLRERGETAPAAAAAAAAAAPAADEANDNRDDAPENPVSAEPPASEPLVEEPAETAGGLSKIFNREVPENAKTYLDQAGIDEARYKAITEAIIRDQIVSRDEADPKYTKQFNISAKQLTRVLQAMDKEGLTSKETGGRVLNVDAAGQPRTPTIH